MPKNNGDKANKNAWVNNIRKKGQRNAEMRQASQKSNHNNKND